MKAIIFDKKNSPHVLVLREVEKPVPGDNEVLVKIHAVSVNAADYRSIRMGISPKKQIYGSDIAGRVETTGQNVKKFRVGDAVCGDISGCGFGGFAEYVAVPESVLALIPAGVSFEDAAAVPMSAVTALQALRDKGCIQPGHKVLIYGAGGGVGTFAIQLVKYFGAEATAVVSPKNAEIARALGADQIIDYTCEDFSKSDGRYDVILAVNGNRSLFDYKRALAPKGICVMVGGALSQVYKSMLFGAILSTGGKKMRFLEAKPDPKDLEFIIQLVRDGKIKPVIDRRYPLHETAEAVRYLSAGHARGKVVITVVQ